jgi:hypothetical protein
MRNIFQGTYLASTCLPPAFHPPKANVISTEATDSLIVRCAVERSLYFALAVAVVFALAVVLAPVVASFTSSF